MKEVLELYAKAIEYYDSIGDTNNSYLYTQKMSMLFMKPHISRMFAKEKIQEARPRKRSRSPEKDRKDIQVMIQNIEVESADVQSINLDEPDRTPASNE